MNKAKQKTMEILGLYILTDYWLTRNTCEQSNNESMRKKKQETRPEQPIRTRHNHGMHMTRTHEEPGKHMTGKRY